MVFMLSSVGLPGQVDLWRVSCNHVHYQCERIFNNLYCRRCYFRSLIYVALYKNVNFGDVKADIKKLTDLTTLEFFILLV